jgi:PAS domain S-box-containing protein
MDGCIVVWNAECERVTGYSAAEIINNRLALEMLYPDIESRNFMLEVAKRRRDDDYSSVWELTAKDGTPCELDYVSRRFSSQSGEDRT